MNMRLGTVYDTWDSRWSYWFDKKSVRTANGYYEREYI